MPLYLVTRPKGAENLKNTSGIHGALVEAADASSAIAVADAMAPDLNQPFSGYDTTEVATSAAADFMPALIQGAVLGNTYSGARRGA